MNDTGLPRGWAVACLDDICIIKDGRRIPVNQDDRAQRIAGKGASELFPYYGATGVIGWIDGYIFEGEHVLLGEDGAPFYDRSKAVAYVAKGRYWVNNHAHVLQALICPHFLCHYLNQFDYHGFVTGTTRLKLNQTAMRSMPILVAPLVEQRAIVAKIEQLFSELDKGVEQLRTVKQQLKQYRQALLKAAFEGKLTAEWRADQQAAGDLPDADELLEQIEKEREKRYQRQLQEWKRAVAVWEAAGGGESGQKKPAEPIRPRATSAVSSMEPSDLGVLPKGWAWLRLSSVGDISGGITKNPKRARLPHRFPYLRVANVYANRLDLQEVDEIGVTGTEYQRAILAANDVLFVEGNGSVDQIGRVAVWNGCISPCLHQNHLIKCRPILPEMARFILYWFLSPVGRSVIVREASSTSGLYTLSISKASSLAIPVTSMAEQQQVLREIDSRFSVLDQLEKAVDHGLQQAEGLRQSILKKAFEGRLLSEAELAAVRNDPEYEPADKLLERIRAEREKDKQSMRSSRAGSTCRETRRGSSRLRQEETNETASEAR